MPARSILLALAMIVTGCAGPYPQGELRSLPPGTPGVLASTDCLHLRVVPVAQTGCGQVALTYAFANRCDRALRVDLRAARVEAEDAEGHPLPLTRRDPNAAVVAREHGVLDVRSDATATVRYDAQGSACARTVCIDLGAVSPGVASDRTCFAIALGDPSTPRAVPTDESPVFEGLWTRDVDAPVTVALGIGRQPVQMRGHTIRDGLVGPFPTDALGTIGSYTAELGASRTIVGPLYAGAALSMGTGSVGSHSLQASPAVTLSGGFVDFGARAFAGVVSPRLGPLRAYAEAFAAVRYLEFFLQERFDCSHDGCASPGRLDAPVGGRIGLDVFLTPWCSVGGWTAIDTRDPSPAFGLRIAFHAHGFDGIR